MTTIKALKSYAARPDDKCGKKAFRYFSNVDLQVLIETSILITKTLADELKGMCELPRKEGFVEKL